MSSHQRKAGSTGLTDAWYQGAFWLYLLAPLALLYSCVILLRTFLFRIGVFSAYRSRLPVIVVGNITVGGTGKSPLVSYLVKSLQEKGYRPGVISRGYGAPIPSEECREVFETSLPAEVGDEPLMLKRALRCPVFVSPNRKLSIQALEERGCDIIISDDGLQHYALTRDVEICVFDGQRGLGNGYILPMGPLREFKGRLSRVDFKVVNGSLSAKNLPKDFDSIKMDLLAKSIRPLHLDAELQSAEQALSASEFSGQCVNAVAAIGNPQRFFDVLESLGMRVNSYAFEDHHAYTLEDFQFEQELPIIMTEKDAVKCLHLGLKNAWYLPVEASLDKDLAQLIVEKI